MKHPIVASAALAAIVLATFAAPAAATESLDPGAVARLAAETAARVSIHRATGAVRFVRPLSGPTLRFGAGGAAPAEAASFFSRYKGAFGISDAAAELALAGDTTEDSGARHLAYQQVYRGVPVFGGIMKVHFNAGGAMTAVNGTFVPSIALNPTPSIAGSGASAAALALVNKQQRGAATDLAALRRTLYVYRAGLARGIAGASHLAYEVEVGNGRGIREFVYVDAHSGIVVDQVTGSHDAENPQVLFRQAFDSEANYPANVYWQEGDAFPTASGEANNTIAYSGDTYDLYKQGFGWNSFDNFGGTMQTIFNRTDSCPNASWNGVFTSYCPGVTGDDVVSHEWTHAYTQYTHDLIYQWQPGALNEAYSDMFGETVDILNLAGLDTPGPLRTAGSCTLYSPPVPLVRINSPASIAQDFPAGAAQFGPPLTGVGTTGDVVLAHDGVGTGVPPAPADTDGCETLINAAEIAGKIAIIDRGSCTFKKKALNAQIAGAIGVIIANHATGGDGVVTMADDPAITIPITIPSAMIGYSNGNIVKNELLVNIVNSTLKTTAGAADDSYRWLIGEDSPSFGGAIRDMWNPTCYSNPGKVSDSQYQCATSDQGGVHSNSGVPNHAYALLVDGGTYNGQTVGSLGFIKAAHIYFRAMSVYQVPTTDFADHADAIEVSCADLIGVNLNDLITGLPSGQILDAANCIEVADAALAVELRTPPVQCNFQPLLDPNAPALCSAGGVQADLFVEDFEAGLGNWTLTNYGVFSGWIPIDWVQDTSLPGGRLGAAAFAVDPPTGNCDGGAGDVSGAMEMTSPLITLPAGVTTPLLAFDHYIATEAGYDGGNVKISVNGGVFLVIDGVDYTFNTYNELLLATNPLAGEEGFTGTDGGAVAGSWGQSQADLTSYATGGDTIRLRFDFGIDGCGNVEGWYVDDVRVYDCFSCATDATPPSVTAPATATVDQTMCSGAQPGATSATSAPLAAFLAGASATDNCDATPTALAAQVSGVDVTATTVFPVGTTTVTFRFEDDSANIGTATSDVTVVLFYGDLNQDGLINAGDAVILSNFLVGNLSAGSPPFTAPLAAADVNVSGGVNAVDAVLLSNRLVGNISCLP